MQQQRQQQQHRRQQWRQCQQCQHVERIDERIGWCVSHAQYRQLRFERRCSEFRMRKSED